MEKSKKIKQSNQKSIYLGMINLIIIRSRKYKRSMGREIPKHQLIKKD